MSFFPWLKGLRGAPEAPTDEAPLPFLLFNLDQLEAHARLSAKAWPVSRRRGTDRLLPRLADNQRRLKTAGARFEAAVRSGVSISPAGEWLLDNQYLIDEQIILARSHLPKGFSRSLPHLTEGPFAGFPRVYLLALEVIAHVDGRIDDENLTRFIRAWQQVAPLSLGELWAIPIMLRLALIENLRRVASRVELGMQHRDLARAWARQIVRAAEQDPRSLLLVAADMARADPPLSNAFVAELVKRLQEQGGLVDIPLTWIDHQLALQGSSLLVRVQAESGDQASNQVSVGSSIGSLRFLGTMAWPAFVEEMSEVEGVLRGDPAGVYANMDFATRDRYRHVVEDLARQAGQGEAAVASLAVDLARRALPRPDGDGRCRHVGYFLMGPGHPALVQALPTLPLHHRLAHRHGRAAWSATYFGLIFGLTLALTGLILALLPGLSLGFALLLAPLLALTSSQLGVMAANWVATTWRAPVTLPRMDLSRAIPDDCRTLVVVPTLLSDLDTVARQLEGLELRYLGNRRRNMYFGLVTDFGDAASRELPGDQALVQAMAAGIREMNERLGSGDLFFLFHRPRQWNPSEGVWMGYERKRGKLEALNQLLRGQDRRPGATAPAFSVVEGDLAALSGTAYVITLDTDTNLPPDAGHKLIGTLAHPLNRPRFDARARRVVEGHAILQPRVAIHLPSTRRSWFVRLNAGEAGTDPYTQAVSDVYQDLFDEGSFIGKGIYDVDAFMQSVQTQLPDNLILSHDLIEGCFARSGLVSDVLLYEDHPSHFLDDVARRRRWARGDWQILFWLLPWAPGRSGRWTRNPLSWLSRWKIVDNLRRSVVPLATLAACVIGLLLLPRPGAVVAAVLALFILPGLLATVGALLRRPGDRSLRPHLRFEGQAAVARLAHGAIGLAFLPEDCRNSVDAIVRAAVRMFFTHRNLLEWRSGSAPKREGLRAFIRAMGFGPLLAMGVAIVRIVRFGGILDPSLLLLVPWFFSPLIAAWLSAERPEGLPPLPVGQQAELRRLARRTWRFFERFVGPEDHWLPPDNFQEQPVPVIAHRTSPTNVGLSMLANLAAHDFGYISAATLLDRTRATVGTVEGLERFRGHLYNWYDTQTRSPMPPLYVSTVDSGNFIGHLMVLETGLRAIGDSPLVTARAWQALGDTLDILAEVCPSLAAALSAPRRSLEPAPTTLVEARLRARALAVGLPPLLSPLPDDDEETTAWKEAALRQLQEALLEPLALADQALAERALGGQALSDPGVPVPTLRALALGGHAGAAAMIEAAEVLSDRVAALTRVDLDFLYDPSRKLFAIGYNVVDHRRDSGCYDLLASEARLISYIAVAQGWVSQAHWFALGRLVTTWRDGAALLSWSGSMFEYLMPQLVMPSFPGTLLDQTSRSVVGRQIERGAQLGIPWGVSESGYNLVDGAANYQYKAFGVPGLGLKRGLGEDQVVAPYATVMAVMVDPVAALTNLRRMRAAGFEGRFGFYEAIDYTPRRQDLGSHFTVVRSYMAHHQGMSLLALASALLDQPMQARFRARATFHAAELLLHERVPRQAALYPHLREVNPEGPTEAAAAPPLFVVDTAHTPRPVVHLLSNGAYSVMITNAGGGYSRFNGLALTRWREDPTRDDWGSFCYVRDVEGGHGWSATYQPSGVDGIHYEAIFPPSRAEFRRRDYGIDLHSEIAVSPEDDVELRRYTLTNLDSRPRTLELTSYAEVVLAPAASDDAHPAFSNLFVQTEILSAQQAILCTRRPRTDQETTPVLLHLMSVGGPTVQPLAFETDRRTFLGRGHSTADALGTMSGTDGSVLDPIVAIRCRVTLAAEQTVSVNVVTGVAPTREAALTLVDKYRDRHMGDRVFELAWTHRQVVLRQLGITELEAELFQRMASAIVYANPVGRASPGVLAKNRRGQSSLWSYGISGDLPIVLLRIASLETGDLVRQVVSAHTWWRRLGLPVDLVIWDETEGGYQDSAREQILSLISTRGGAPALDVPGGIFLRRREQFADEDRILVQTMARILLTGGGGSLAEQFARKGNVHAVMPALQPRLSALPVVLGAPAPEPPADGFIDQGRAYRITTSPTRRTPAPWSNILSNPHFGSLVTESGGGYTWCENSHEFRLSPWDNDPISDRSGESYYLRDEETGAFWSPTPLPARGAAAYETRHQAGSSVFVHTGHGICSTLTMFVAIDAPVKVVLLKLENRTDRERTLSVTGCCEWVLGEHRSRSLLHVTTEHDPTSGAMLARNPYHPEFGARIGFFDLSERRRTVTGDRTEFLGRNGHPARPAAMGRERLSGRVGAGLDACAAMMARVDLGPGASHEVVFVLGLGREIHDVHTLLKRFGQVAQAQQALNAVQRHWDAALGALRIQTPDPSLDILVNQWLPYQVIACRLWARTGFYQSGGAFGFRDQLQDAMAMVYHQPAILREQIVRCAGRQYHDGDVQHWWHPPVGRGVRTHCSDDYLWLPAAVVRYLSAVSDPALLDVRVPYLEGRQVKPDEEAYGDLPRQSETWGTVYEHCARAIQRGLRFGVHGLPLMGSGDWNDGMNLVGAQGRGESVWLAFFLYDLLVRFVDVAAARGDQDLSELCRQEAAALAVRIEVTAWDGEWYRRAWFDSGEPLGSQVNTECRIDSLPQSWAVLSGAGAPERARRAMLSVDHHLVDREAGLIKLFTPPFDQAIPNPGYIRGYVPGVRENGGQYTHAALWAAMAFARLGDAERAWELTSMLNPGSHTGTPAERERYRVEPYVLAADVYAVAPHDGMGGWTWHTGSAGWMLRLVVESLLGLRVAADRLFLTPCVPATWSGFTIHYRYGQTQFELRASPAADGQAKGSLRLDGRDLETPFVLLVDDQAAHVVEIRY